MRALALACLLVSAAAGALPAATIRVPADWPTLRAAIDQAVTGDTVLVAPGIYTGPGNRDLLIDGKDIAIIGAGGSAQTVLDLSLPSGWRHGFTLRGQTRQMLLRGFTICHGYGEYVVSSGGINIEDASPTLEDLQIIDCNVSENFGPSGAGIRCLNSSPLLRDILLQNCEGFAAVHLEDGAPELEDMTIRNCDSRGMNCWNSGAALTRVSFIENSVYGYLGGALLVSGAASPTLRDCLFQDNYAYPEIMDMGYGGAIACGGCSPVIERTVFRGNMCAMGGAISLDGCEGVVLSTILFADNHAERGAALYLRSSSVLADNLTFAENGADWVFGMHDPDAPAGAIYGQSSSSLSLNASIVALTAQGPGLHMAAPASADVACSDFFANAGGHTSGTVGNIIGLNGNISVDPLFCDAPGGDYTLDAASPCLPANNDCHVQMGAFGWGCGTTAAEETAPAAFAFAPPQPNPFNPKATLRFALPRAAAVDLVIFDVNGRQVRRLLAGEQRPAGHHALDWNGRDESGRALPSGVYFARFAAGGFTAERRLVLLR